MKELRQWVNWRPEQITEASKVEKVPYCLKRGMHIDVCDESNWLTYQEAKVLSPLVGFILTDNDPYFCINLDNVLTPDGTWTASSLTITDLFSGAFKADSYSKTGFHIWGKVQGTIPKHKGRKPLTEGIVELYTDKRFVTFTETNCIGNYNEDFTTELHSFVKSYLSSPIKGKGEESVNTAFDVVDPAWSGPSDDHKLIEKMLSSKRSTTNKADVHDCWRQNVLALAKTYPPNTINSSAPFDRYRADLALMNHLAFWTGKDLPRMIRMAWLSKLTRKEWSASPSYLRNTAQKACEHCTNVYSYVEKLPRYDTELSIKPLGDDEIKSLVDLEVSPISTTLKKTDHGMLGKSLFNGPFNKRFCALDGTIRWWSARQWELAPEKIVKAKISDALPNKFSSHATLCGVHAMFTIDMVRKPKVEPTKKIFWRNGVLDPITMEFEKHQRTNYNTRTLTVDYKTSMASAPIVEFVKFLISTFGSLDDDRVLLLQEIIGWLLIDHNLGIEKFIAFVGASRAGKGVLLKLLESILGADNCGAMNFDTIGSPQGHDILRKYSVVFDDEASAPKRDDKSAVKTTIQKLTSGGKMASRVLFQNSYIEGVVNSKLIIACNDLPVLSDDSVAFLNRVNILKFERSFYGKEDVGLLARLLMEKEGIVWWALQGLQRLMRNNGRFTLPESTKAENDAYMAISMPLTPFVNDCLASDSEAITKSTDLYAVYTSYCQANGMKIWSIHMFIKRLKATLLGKEMKWGRYTFDGRQNNGVKGLKISAQTHEPLFSSYTPASQPHSEASLSKSA